MATERVLHMKGGAGETSYSKSSLLQRKVILKAKHVLEESVKRMMSNTTYESCWKIAEIGCSSGSNAIMVVSDIMNIIGNTSLNLNHGSPVFQIYLNDLFGNDFNTIFKLLPDFYQSISQRKGDKVGACFIHATPGNFYGRLFPNNYIHFFHSSYSLHWLSQAPKDSTSIGKPLNKGNTYITSTSPPSVYQAYFEQFERDLKLFLKSRSEELMSGGIMVLTFIGREKAREIKSPWVVIGMVLNDMVQEGLIEEAKLDFFDLPLYGPTAEEVRQVIDAEGSFKIETLKIIKMSWDANLQEDVDGSFLDSITRGEFIAKYIRAVFEPLLAVEFGEDIMDELFSRFAKLVAELTELETLEYTNLIVSMTK
ncbi:probable jasmonic acid carboxyl methyltransferase 2 [Gastrolobium bilobum]|uniref:probable jasmonic acid carboxyl methyltransferase 2 n=1 Tax=Gastrolobium bilobum TaxID=150636 RepID=UPI002AB06EE0|nr:probable jasmonic acid carboxyl methyltransferase 2 [Gastrolobium bilobum]